MMIGRISAMNLRAKMMLFYSALVVLPLILFGVIYYQLSAQSIADQAAKNIAYANAANCQLSDQRLRSIEDSIRAINADSELFSALSRLYDTDYEIKQMDTKIVDIISKYFRDMQWINAVNIVTEQYTYGSSTVVTAGDVFSSALYERAATSGEWIQWIPTYHIPKQFTIDYLMDIRDDALFSFSAFAVMNPVSIDPNNRAVQQAFPAHLRKPVLMIHFSPDFFSSMYQSNTNVPGSFFCLSDQDGVIIAHTDPEERSKSGNLPWLGVPSGSTGQYDYADHRLLVSVERSAVTGWVSALAVPVDMLLSDVTGLLPYLFGLEALLVALALLIVYGITAGITRPVHQLTGALKRTGRGELGGQIPETAGGEIGYLIRKFNEMSTNLRVLVDENYKVRLREKEAEITALNTQLNPHLLYNTLNIINLEAMDRGETEISQMLIALSRMLQYTVINKQDLASLRDDLEWLRRYVYIMSMRYEGLFEVRFDIDEALQGDRVPKLFLQPFVENAILHGFKGKKLGGRIDVSGTVEGGKRVYCVRDNGVGIAQEKLSTLLTQDSEGIGIANVAKRIALIYGGDAQLMIESKLGEGTEVRIVLP